MAAGILEARAMARRNAAHVFIDASLLDDHQLKQVALKLARTGAYATKCASRNGALGYVMHLWLLSLTHCDRHNRLNLPLDALTQQLGADPSRVLPSRWFRNDHGVLTLPGFWRKNESARRHFYRQQKRAAAGDKSGDSCSAAGDKSGQLGLPLLGVIEGDLSPPAQHVAQSTASDPPAAVDCVDNFPSPLSRSPLSQDSEPQCSHHTPSENHNPRAAERTRESDAARRPERLPTVAELQPFEVFLQAYPQHLGMLSRERTLAAIVFEIRAGRATWGSIVDGALRYREHCTASGKTDGQYVMNPLRFVQERWYAAEFSKPQSESDAINVERVRAILREKGIT